MFVQRIDKRPSASPWPTQDQPYVSPCWQALDSPRHSHRFHVSFSDCYSISLIPLLLMLLVAIRCTQINWNASRHEQTRADETRRPVHTEQATQHHFKAHETFHIQRLYSSSLSDQTAQAMNHSTPDDHAVVGLNSNFSLPRERFLQRFLELALNWQLAVSFPD